MPTPASVLAVNVWQTGTTPDLLVVLDAATLLPVTGSPFTTDGTSNASIVSPDNRWLAICGSTSYMVQLMDLTATPLVLGPPIACGTPREGVVFSPDSSKLYAVGGGGGPVHGPNAITVITVTGTAPGTVLRKIGVWTGAGTLAARPGQNLAIYTDAYGHDWLMVPGAGAFPATRSVGIPPPQVAFVKISGTTSTTTPPPTFYVTVGAGPTAVAIAGTTGYVCNYTDKTLGKLDLTPLPGAPPIYTATALPVGVGAPPYWVRVRSGTSTAYVSCTAFTGVTPSITAVNLTTFAVTDTITSTLVGPTAGGFSPDGTQFFSATTDLVHHVYQVSVVTVALGTVINTLPQTGICAGAAVSSGTVAPPGLGALMGVFAALGTRTPPPPTVTGTATLTSAAVLSATATVRFTATASLTAAGTLVGTARTLVIATASVVGSGLLAGSATIVIPATASLGGGATVAGTATVIVPATAGLVATTVLAASASEVLGGTAALAATALLIGTATVTISATAALVATGVLTASASEIVSATAALVVGATLSAVGSVPGLAEGDFFPVLGPM